MDILQATLASGIRVVKFVPSYGDQPNDITHVTKCTFVARFFGGRCGAVMLTDCMRARVCRLQGQVPWIPRTCFCLYARASMGAPATRAIVLMDLSSMSTEATVAQGPPVLLARDVRHRT